MTQYSYSRVDLFERCPYHYKIRYIDRLTELPRYDADNPLFLGHALHKGIELDEYAMEQDYLNAYPVIANDMVNELIKLKILLPKVKAVLSQFKDCKLQHEYRISSKDYIGFADLIITAPDGTSSVIDFKYSNHIDNYLESGQLHIYKYYLQKQGFDIRHLAYIFIPKTSIRQKKDEDLYHFRKRLIETVNAQEVKLVPINYDEMQMVYFVNAIKKIESTNNYPKNVNNNCFSCNPRFAPSYLEAIQDEKGEILMQLPKNQRREKKIDLKPDTWLYADSYVGKTTFWDQFDNVLMINTDGNTDNTTSPFMSLKDEVTKEGRLRKRKFAWQSFLELIQELETENTEGYETIVLDLVEDVRDDCRNFIMDKYGWEHESDGSYGKGWSMVTKEFSNAIKRLKAVGLQIVYISKELAQDVTLSGNKVRTTYKPNIDDKTANFLTGTVDITMRAYVNEHDQHVLQLAKQPNVFGGGRFDFKEDVIPLEKEAFLNALEDAQTGRSKKTTQAPAKNVEAEDKPAKKTRKRRAKKEEVDNTVDDNSETKPNEPVDTIIESETPDVQDMNEDITPPGEDDEPTEDEEPKPRRRRRHRSVEE